MHEQEYQSTDDGARARRVPRNHFHTPNTELRRRQVEQVRELDRRWIERWLQPLLALRGPEVEP